jgi:acylphosphatase
MTRKTIHFFGNVQGVGFRYTARSIANGFAVAGYVRNRRDGSVELVAEGEAEEIEHFLAALRERMDGYINHEETAESPETGLIGGFEIRH